MGVRNFFTKQIILPFSDFALGNSLYEHLDFLNKSQFWTREGLDEYQNEQLEQLIYHITNHVPYYRDLFKTLRLTRADIKTKSDLYKIPILTKEEIKRNKKKFVADNISDNQRIFISSSGSTGEPLQFYITKKSDSFQKATAIRGWEWMGYKFGDPYVKISMNPRNSRLKKIQDAMNHCKYLSSTQLLRENFEKIAKEIISFDPSILRCYPVPLLLLADVFEVTGQKIKALKAINTTGSTLHDSIRSKVEGVFGVKIYDSYSCEGGTVYFQCENHHNYHPAEEYAISEFVEDDFTKNDPENPRRLITTDLVNYAFPFLRYDTQDYLVLGDGVPCPCGRHFLNVKKIKGRDSDVLITPSGKFLIVENFVAYFKWIKEVEQIQVIQSEINQITINLIVNSLFTDETLKRLYDYWSNYIGDDVELTIQKVKEIKLTPTGKRRTLIRNPKIRISVNQ